MVGLAHARVGGNRANTWLVAPAGAVKDMAGEPSLARVNGLNALGVGVLVTDQSAPEANRFDISINGAFMTINFDEVVLGSVAQVNKVSLQSSVDSAQSVNLTAGVSKVIANEGRTL